MSTFPNKAPIAASSDPETSHIAGAKLTSSGKRDSDKAKVLKALRDFPGTTSAELAQYGKLDRHMVARRLPDLEHDGHAQRGLAQVCGVTAAKALTWWPTRREEK